MSAACPGGRRTDRCRVVGRRLLPSRLAMGQSQQPPPTFRRTPSVANGRPRRAGWLGRPRQDTHGERRNPDLGSSEGNGPAVHSRGPDSARYTTCPRRAVAHAAQADGVTAVQRLYLRVQSQSQVSPRPPAQLHPRWKVDQLPDGTFRWTTPSGRTYDTEPDREQAIEVLKDAFAQGRLTIDELDVRAGQAFTARTRAELTSVIADLPAMSAPAARRPSPARAKARPVDPEVKAGIRVIITTTAIAALLLVVAVFTGSGAAAIAAAGAIATVLVAASLTGSRVLGSWLDQRRGGAVRVAASQSHGPRQHGIRRPRRATPAGQSRSAAHRRSSSKPLAHPRSPGSRSAHQWRHRGTATRSAMPAIDPATTPALDHRTVNGQIS
jgi:hypothetical protein